MVVAVLYFPLYFSLDVRGGKQGNFPCVIACFECDNHVQFTSRPDTWNKENDVLYWYPTREMDYVLKTLLLSCLIRYWSLQKYPHII